MLMSSAFGVQNDEAKLAINRADSAIASAYQAVLEAEEAGANISCLLKDLNLGAEALAKANTLYRIGNFDEAVVFADSCYDSVVNVAAKADGLRDFAVAERKKQLLIASTTSAFGITLVIFAGIFCWRLFKKQYLRRVLKMKPDLNKASTNILEKCS